jgi:hypothetical protein
LIFFGCAQKKKGDAVEKQNKSIQREQTLSVDGTMSELATCTCPASGNRTVTVENAALIRAGGNLYCSSERFERY